MHVDATGCFASSMQESPVSIMKSSPGRTVTSDLNALLEQVEQAAALLKRYSDSRKDGSAGDLFGRLRDFLSGATHDSTDAAERSFASVLHAGEDLVGRARSSGAQGFEDVSGALSRNPLTAVLAAACIGVTIGALLRRR
jgi:ElaB/YqjD/DUF883 family membrane-anchored ribosome-binding protein